MEKKASAEKAIREIRRKTRRRFSAEEKIRIVIEALRGEENGDPGFVSKVASNPSLALFESIAG